MTIEEVLLALGAQACAARRVGRATWAARCPACGDELSLTASATGLVGLLCRSGCPYRRVWAALEATS